jgi:hypothetical protein
MLQAFVGEVRRWLAGAVAIVVVGSVTPAAAQQSRATISVGGAIGGSLTGDSWSGGGAGPLGAAHIDLPVSQSGRLRFDAGLVGWSPNNDVVEGPAAGRVWLSHAGVTVLGYCDDPSVVVCLPGVYLGFGIARYRYSIEHGDVAHRTPLGMQGVLGVEHFPDNRHWGYHVEGAVAFIGGPGHGQIWATTLPALSVAVGLSRRF